MALSYGAGRVVVMGEAAELSAQLAGLEPMGMNVPGIDNRQMALNIVRWLGEGARAADDRVGRGSDVRLRPLCPAATRAVPPALRGRPGSSLDGRRRLVRGGSVACHAT